MTDFSPLTAAGLYDRAIYIYKKSFGKQIAFAAIYGVISYVALFVVSFFLIFVFAFIAAIIGAAADSPTGIIVVFSITFLSLFIMWMSISSAGHIILSRQALYGHNVKLNVKQLMRVSMRVFLTMLAQVIVSLPFIGLGVFLFRAIFLTWTHANDWLTLAVFVTLFISYMLYLNIFSLAIAASVFEQKSFMSALVRSWELVRDKFWQVAAIRALWIVVILAVWSAVYGALFLFNMLMDFLFGLVNLGVLGTGVTAFFTVVTVIASFIAMFAIMPMDGVFHATMYFDRRIKKEGFDIEIRLERLKESDGVGNGGLDIA